MRGGSESAELPNVAPARIVRSPASPKSAPRARRTVSSPIVVASPKSTSRRSISSPVSATKRRKQVFETEAHVPDSVRDLEAGVELASRIQAIIAFRDSLQRYVNCCSARTFRLFQCTRRFADANAIPQVCHQHFERWRRHGLIGQPITDTHMTQLNSYI